MKGHYDCSCGIRPRLAGVRVAQVARLLEGARNSLHLDKSTLVVPVLRR